MHVEWYGQSAFHLSSNPVSVAIDPFGDMSALTSRGGQFEYPAIEGVTANLLLVTHEHVDHNGVEVIGGHPAILRSTAGKLGSPLGEVRIGFLETADAFIGGFAHVERVSGSRFDTGVLAVGDDTIAVVPAAP